VGGGRMGERTFQLTVEDGRLPLPNTTLQGHDRITITLQLDEKGIQLVGGALTLEVPDANFVLVYYKPEPIAHRALDPAGPALCGAPAPYTTGEGWDGHVTSLQALRATTGILGLCVVCEAALAQALSPPDFPRPEPDARAANGAVAEPAAAGVPSGVRCA